MSTHLYMSSSKEFVGYDYISCLKSLQYAKTTVQDLAINLIYVPTFGPNS